MDSFNQILNISDQFKAVDGSGVTLTTADTTQVFGGTPSAFKYVQPALSLSGALSIQKYTDAKAKILALEEGKTPTALRYTVLNTTDGNTNSTTIDQEFKDKEIAALNEKYMNAVSIETQSATNQHYVTWYRYNWNSTDKCADTWNDIRVCDPTYLRSRTWMTQTYGDFAGYKTDKIFLVLVDNTETACQNAEYAVNGLKVSIAGREVNAPLSVKLSYDVPSTVGTFATTAKLGNTTGAAILLSNSALAPLSADSFDGTYTLKDKNGKSLVLTATSAINITLIKDADGRTIAPTGSPAVQMVSATTIAYDYATTSGSSTYGIQFTMNAPLSPGMAKKVVIKMNITDTKLVGVNSNATAQNDIEFTLELE